MLAVNLRGGCDQDLFLKTVGQSQHRFGPLDVGFQCLHGMVHNVHDPDGSGQMVDMVHLESQFIHHGLVEYGIHHQVQLFVVLDLRQILQPACPEVVDDKDLMAQCYEPLCEMRSDETCAPCY